VKVIGDRNNQKNNFNNIKMETTNTNKRLNGLLLIIAFLISSTTFSVIGQNDCKNLLRAVKANDINKVTELLKTTEPDCIFRGDGEPRSPLVAATRNENLAMVKLLIEANANVEFHAKGDESPFIAASRTGNVELVKYFMSKGVKVNTKVKGNGTALIASVRNNHYEVSKLLLEKGANPYLASSGDEYPIYHARQSRNKKLIKLLESYIKN
jgi:ankyrin repeat protein